MKTEAKIEIMLLQVKACVGLPENRRDKKESQRLQRKQNPADTLISPQEIACERTSFCVLKSPSFCYFLMAALGT